jgi:hypothetical protein
LWENEVFGYLNVRGPIIVSSEEEEEAGGGGGGGGREYVQAETEFSPRYLPHSIDAQLNQCAFQAYANLGIITAR